MTDKVVHLPPGLAKSDQALIARIVEVLPIVADVSRADILLCLATGRELVIAAQARPHSIAPIHKANLVGEPVHAPHSELIWEALRQNRPVRGARETTSEGAPIVQEILPVRGSNGMSIGALLIETNLLESERQRRRGSVFQRAVKDLQWMATRGEPGGAAELTAFGEFDGLIYADAERVIRYMSGIAINFYGNIGYPEALLGKPLNYLETADDSLIREALETGRAVEAEIEEKGRIWIKRAVPLMPGEGRRLLRTAPRRASGALLMIRDETEARESARELRIKTTMIKEVHHRVKNDLQTVAALLRMQGRRLQTDEAQTALGEAVNRILSIAVIHEFLSEQDSRVINIREVAQRILNQMQSGVLDPTRGITLSLAGPNIFLPARQATSCALVVNELLQNALEHGLAARERGGHISLTFADEGETVCLDVHDDGQGLPAGFDLERVDSLGLRIVQMLVTEDLKGQFELKSDGGVSAIVRFPKIPLEGEIAWKELE